MCPPHIVQKWARETLLTVPHARAFIVEDLRNGVATRKNSHGIVEVELERGQTVVRGITTTLPKLRQHGTQRVEGGVPQPAFFIMSKEKGKALATLLKHAFAIAKSGPELGGLELIPIPGRCESRRRMAVTSAPLDLRDDKFNEELQGREGRDNSLLASVAGRSRKRSNEWPHSILWEGT